MSSWSASPPPACSVGRELPLRLSRGRRPVAAAADGRFETRVVPLLAGRRRGRVLEPDTGARRRPARSGRRHGCSALRSGCAARSCAATARTEARLPDRQHRPRRGARLPGPRGLRVPGRRRVRGGQRRHPADVRDRAVAAGRGLRARLRRGSVRPGPDDRVPRTAPRRVAVRIGRGSDRADGPGRRADARAALLASVARMSLTQRKSAS